MKIIAINGSPRRDKGLTYRVLSNIISGAQKAGAECKFLHLIDDHPQYCVHCGHDCFDELDCIQEESATIRSRTIEEYDVVVLGAPVYVWQPSGLTAAFFDKLRLGTGSWRTGQSTGRLALGIAVAGGTGSGVFTALQSIYAWFCLWKFFPLDPIPVTRFNLEDVSSTAEKIGRSLTEMKPDIFKTAAELMLRYDQLTYMNYKRIDEFRWLANRIVDGFTELKRESGTIDIMNKLLMEAQENKKKGNFRLEAQNIMEAYRIGFEKW